MAAREDFLAARDFLLSVREDYERAVAEFRWPALTEFNWALDHFDHLEPDALALWIVHEDGSEEKLTFGDLQARSNQLANHLRSLGVRRGDRLLLMLGNVTPLWVTMLAATKIGAVIIPTSTLLGAGELADRLERGQVRVVVTAAALAGRFVGLAGAEIRISVDNPVATWASYADASDQPVEYEPDQFTQAGEPLFLYFTSGTTSQPKLVEHSHVSYPVGHLSTMFWIGVRPGDIHLNISSPGWGKHAWSNLFGPWNAGATVFVVNQARFDAPALLREMRRCEVTTFCAPPTVWRLLVQHDLASYDLSLREVIGAGEPLNAEIIDQVRTAWGLTIRDGFGQTETTAMCGNSPGQPVKDGSMGRPLPGYSIVLLDPDGNPADEGEICLDLSDRPLGLMVGYRDDESRTADATAGGYYHTGDVARRDSEGYITYVGRTDDVFKASDYRISPFELESVLIEHPAVAEAAIVPSPDPIRLAVPKAYVVLASGHEPTAETAAAILTYCRGRLAPFKRIRRIEFAELPKTISGKIRRVELRTSEHDRAGEARKPQEFWEEDLEPR
ncbi:MAG: AMP-binding protein [Actinomycetota bacterium]|nr:AMP-binding protein [Actinomycetota bacterium]